MTRDQILDAMKYLGYPIRTEQGDLRDDAYATAAALAGRVTENITLPSAIATEYAKHNPTFMKGEFDPNIPARYCTQCGERAPCSSGHNAPTV